MVLAHRLFPLFSIFDVCNCLAKQGSDALFVTEIFVYPDGVQRFSC
jgi:hypothetical protein